MTSSHIEREAEHVNSKDGLLMRIIRIALAAGGVVAAAAGVWLAFVGLGADNSGLVLSGVVLIAGGASTIWTSVGGRSEALDRLRHRIDALNEWQEAYHADGSDTRPPQVQHSNITKSTGVATPCNEPQKEQKDPRYIRPRPKP